MSKNELKILIPTEEIITSNGEIILKPFKFKDFPKALNLVSQYVEMFATSEDSLGVIQKLLENSGERFIEDVCALVELVSSKNKDFLDELNWDEVVSILVTIIEQNKDFFSRIGKRLNPEKPEENPTSKAGE